MILREFQESDAEYIVNWIGNEREFRMWCADRYEKYPIAAEDIINNYRRCSENGGFFPLTAVNEEGRPIGHIIIRYTDIEKKTVRYGFVIIDSSLRGKGAGREMLMLAEKYAAEFLKAEKITLGVFEENTSALKCYAESGFVPTEQFEYVQIAYEKWTCLELEKKDIEHG